MIRGKGGRRPPPLVQFGPEGEGRASCPGWPSLSPLRPIRPITLPGGGVLVTLRHSGFLRNHPGHFRCQNIVVQYINLYVSTISRLLVMSVITSGTPKKLRYIKTYKLIINLSSKRYACGPYGFENYVDMTETHLRSITNSGTWMLILAPTYSTKIFIGQTA